MFLLFCWDVFYSSVCWLVRWSFRRSICESSFVCWFRKCLSVFPFRLVRLVKCLFVFWCTCFVRVCLFINLSVVPNLLPLLLLSSPLVLSVLVCLFVCLSINLSVALNLLLLGFSPLLSSFSPLPSSPPRLSASVM